MPKVVLKSGALVRVAKLDGSYQDVTVREFIRLGHGDVLVYEPGEHLLVNAIATITTADGRVLEFSEHGRSASLVVLDEGEVADRVLAAVGRLPLARPSGVLPAGVAIYGPGDLLEIEEESGGETEAKTEVEKAEAGEKAKVARRGGA